MRNLVAFLTEIGFIDRSKLAFVGSVCRRNSIIATQHNHGVGLVFEAGLVAGVSVSIMMFLYRTSRPHIAQIGLIPGTEYFRNVTRHQVLVSPRLLSMRVDESLYFANARHLESLEAIDQRLAIAGLTLSLSEVKGPVMDRLKRSDFLDHLSGQVFLTHFQAVSALTPELINDSE